MLLNGQANNLVVAAMTLAVVDVARGRRWGAVAWLVLGVAAQAARGGAGLLAGGRRCDRRCGGGWRWGWWCWRHCLGCGPTGGMWQQHLSFVEKMRVATKPPPGTNQDLINLLWSVGVTLPDRAWTVIRVVGALGALWLAILAQRRFERWVSLVYVLAISILYIMLFNPRTEGPTHAMMGMVLGVFGARELIARPGVLAWTFVVACVLMGEAHELVRPNNPWTQPLLDLWFAAYLIWHIVRGRAALPLKMPLYATPVVAGRGTESVRPGG